MVDITKAKSIGSQNIKNKVDAFVNPKAFKPSCLSYRP